jgi:rhodanese-related sulfurtransferase
VGEVLAAYRLPIATDVDVRLIIACHEGYSSSLAAATLQELGLRFATDLVGGFQAWTCSSIESHDQSPDAGGCQPPGQVLA